MRSLLALLCVAPLACGDSGGGSGGASETGNATSLAPTSEATTAAPTSTNNDSDASASATTTLGESTSPISASSTGAGPKFDLGGMPDLGGNPCGGDTGGNQPEFSYIWVANTYSDMTGWGLSNVANPQG